MSGEAFGQFIASRIGCDIPPRIEPDKFVRFPTNGKRGDDAGWAKLFPDGEGGVFGDFRSGETWTWQAKRERRFSPVEFQAWQAKIEQEKREAEAQREAEANKAASKARDIWAASKPAPEDHAYLTRKGVESCGLRIYSGPSLVIREMECEGVLILPLRNSAGEIRALEFISLGGEKRFLPRGDYRGCYFAIGKPGRSIAICEGFATGASIHAATGLPVRIAATAGNLVDVAKAIREKAPDARLILCADNDRLTVCPRHKKEGASEALSPLKPRPEWCRCNPGLTSALEAARAVGGLLASPEIEGGTDFNDMAAQKGAEPIKTAIESACSIARTEEAEDVSGLVLRRVSEVVAKPVRWLWPGRIARGKVSMLAGHPGLGKSQACISLAATVSTGGLWPVDRTACERGSVLIFSAEDDAEDTIRPRLEAAGADLSRCHILDAVEVRGPDGKVTRRGFSLSVDLPRLAAKLAELGDVALVIIDPVTAYLGETDSHKAADVRAMLAPLGEVAARYGAAIVAVSHLRKSGAGEAMLQVTGSLAFVAAARAAYIVAKDQADPARRLMLPAKNNLGDDQTGYAFRIESVELPGGIQTSRVTWEAERVTMTADEALAPAQATEDRSATDEAADWLRELLAAGPMKASDVQREARQAGIGDKPLRAARERLGIKPRKRAFAGGWEWGLGSAQDAQDAQDAPSQDMGTFGGKGHLREPAGVAAQAGDADSEVI